jgi:iron-sulfur cluster assembly protein
MSVQLTESAANYISTMLQKRGSGVGLRLGVTKSGCSGFQYVVDYADEVETDDTVFNSHNIKIIINKESLPFLKGIEVDYVKNNILNKGLEFRNPNVKDQCGCGTSFNV